MRSRSFIEHAVRHGVKSFEEELKWIYLGTDQDSPCLLRRAINVAREVIRTSEKDEGSTDGLRRISKGAVIPLKRQLSMLEAFMTGGT